MKISTLKLSFLGLMLFSLCSFQCGQKNGTNDAEAVQVMPDEIMDSAYFEGQRTVAARSAQYTQALSDYIESMFAKVKPDTLFIMSVANDHDVVFPNEIAGIKIGYYPADNFTQEAIQRRKTTISLNIAGWPEALSSEFIFVTFFSDARPQHNFHSYYSRKDTTQAFVRDSARFEYQYDNTTPLSEYLGK